MNGKLIKLLKSLNRSVDRLEAFLISNAPKEVINLELAILAYYSHLIKKSL